MTEDEKQIVVYEILKVRIRLLDYCAAFKVRNRKHLIITDETALDNYPFDAILEGIHNQRCVVSCCSREDAFAFTVMYGGDYIFMDDYIRCDS